jgi:hypothetical protein
MSKPLTPAAPEPTPVTIPEPLPVVLVKADAVCCPLCGSDDLTAWEACRRAHRVKPGEYEGDITLVNQGQTDDGTEDFEVWCHGCQRALAMPEGITFQYE